MTEPIGELRAARAAARDEIGRAAARLAAARAAGSTGGPTDSALAALQAARASESALRDRLSAAVAGIGPAIVDSIATLDARFPVALLPVRVETRFVPGSAAPGPVAPGLRSARGPASAEAGASVTAPALLVRIYPDSILADSHEPLLTAAEADAGRAYWRRTFATGQEHDAWTALLGLTSAERAAWIVEQTTPSNVEDRGDATGPVFAPVDLRSPNWHRAPEARGLPDRWIVSAFRGTERIHQVVSEPVREGLALTPRLSGDLPEPGDDDEVDISGDGLTVEPALRWAYDFEEALAAGMAVRIALTPIDLENGFGTLLVLGVRTGETAEEQAAQLGQLLTGHRYSRGLAFVAQGTPTNNTGDAPSAFPGDDPAGAVSFAVARGGALAGPGTDGARFATALGLPASVVDRVAGAGRDEQSTAAAMARALWPATVGYFLEQLFAPEISTATAAAVRRFMADWVRPRGPLPALRVGAVPYGVLPVGAHSRWAVRPAEGVPTGLPEQLVRMAGLAATHTGLAARVGRSGDPDADLVAVLGMDASARTARIRRSFGYDATWNIFGYAGRDRTALQEERRRIGEEILDVLGQDGRDPRVLHLSYLRVAHDFGGPMVGPAPLSESDPLAFDYVAWLEAATPTALRQQEAPPVPVTALLYLMLRQGLLAEYDASARRLLEVSGFLLPHESREAELVGILPERMAGRAEIPTVRTVWERFDLRIPGTGDRTVGEFLADPGRPGGGTEALAEYRQALQRLVGVPTAELDRLFTETLDACSHRVDAWLTGLATRRLADLRTPSARLEGGPAQPTTGIYLGCYGWVVDLHPDPPRPTVEVSTATGERVAARTDSDGFIYAPSMLHAATAAVLHSGYRARAGQSQQPYAIDLSSARVRSALAVLDAVRHTQPLGAVLGYAFERGLHESHPGVELDRYIDDFRRLYPAVANKSEDTGDPADRVAARTVVDGLALLRAWRAGQIPWSDPGLATTAIQRTAIEAELVLLDDTVDAVSDLLLGESVFQVLKGSPAGAAATLDSLSRGQRPPEPEVVTTPRGGTVLHQRVAVLFGDGTTDAAWAGVPVTPRAAAAPELDGWLAGLLGDPARVACTVARPGVAPARVTLRDLGLRPVDLLVLVQDALATGRQDELDHRIARRAYGSAYPGPVTVDYDDPGPADLSVAAACEVMAAAARLIGHGRPLTATDLLPPTGARTTEVPNEALVRRAVAATQALTTARQAVATAGTDPASLRAALDRAAWFGLPEALFASDGTEIARTIDARLAAVAAATTPRAALTAIFGTALPVIGPFRPERPDLLAPALATEPGLGDDPDSIVEGWLAQVARVQPAVDAWRDVQIYGRSLGRDLPRPRIAQMPAGPAGVAWAGLEFPSEERRPRSGLVSLALLGQAPPAADAPWCGLMLVEWPEVIPAREEEAGLTMQFDAPGAQAPQALLIAVPPDTQPSWSYDALERTLLDTLSLAQIRALELSHLGEFGQVIPMTYLAENTARAAVSTSFAGLLVADATVEARP